jgi:hypothetical protein
MIKAFLRWKFKKKTGALTYKFCQSGDTQDNRHIYSHSSEVVEVILLVDMEVIK